MPRILRNVLVITALLYGMGIALTAGHAAAQDRQAGAASTSQQDKMKACNDLADKKGLKGDDRRNFLQSCTGKTTNVQPLNNVSQRDKMNACKNLADRKNLQGEDRRSFIKDCMNKVNSK
jgi:hypothetical protein